MIIVVQTLVYFRESIFDAIQNVFGYLYLSLKRKSDEYEDEECEEVFSDYHEEKGVVFFPPVYVQRYAAVLECLTDKQWRGKLEKVVDLGYHDASFVNHLKDLPGIKTIMAVDIDKLPLRCAANCLNTNLKETIKIELYQGNAADPDYRLIGCDAVVAIEMIEHMLPHDLERLVHTIFGFIKPQLAVITTPNGDFNVLFKSLEPNGLRRLDHFFEWSRSQFHDWCGNIVTRYPQYTVTCKGIGPGPEGTEHLGCCSQLAFFVSKDYHKQMDLNLNSLVQVFEVQNSDDNISSDWKVTTTDLDTAYSSLELSSSGTSSYTFETSYSSADTVCKDKIVQCDLDVEYIKDLQFNSNDHMFLKIVKSRKCTQSYVIEDISCRLNCSMSHVRKFPKDIMDLIDNNKNTPLFFIKDIISNLNTVVTKAEINTKEESTNEIIWKNINWGDNSPYWNQYYKVVKELNYPIELQEKSDNLNMVDIVLTEIDRLVEINKDLSDHIVMPMSHVMELVRDFSDDEDYVREYLQWNDFEFTDDALVYYLPIADTSGESNDDLLTNTKSDELIIVPKTNTIQYISQKDDNEIERALRDKSRHLKFIMNTDNYCNKVEDITYRLASLALLRARISGVPKVSWFKWRLLNILNFTERSVRRTRHDFLQSYKMFSANECEKEAFHNQLKYKDDTTMVELLDKYDHLLHPKETSMDNFMEDFTSSLSNEPSSTLIKQRSILTDSQSRLSLFEECDSLGSGDPELLSQNLSDGVLKGTKCTLKEFHAMHFDKIDIAKSIEEYSDTKYSVDDQNNYRSENGEMINDIIKYDDFGSEPTNGFNIIDSDSRERFSVHTVETSEQGSIYAKPIPNGIIELCKIRENNYNPDLIDCDNKELCKEMATKMDEEHAQETMAFVCPTIDVKTNRCLSKSSKFFSENQSENVMLFDENEPSTSKGIRRHVRMDVQCGSDTEINVSMLNVLPQNNSMGSHIHSSLTNLDPDALSDVPSTKINYFEKAIKIKESTSSINIKEDYEAATYSGKHNILQPSISNSKDIYKHVPENNIVEKFIQDINLDKNLEISLTPLVEISKNTKKDDSSEHKIKMESDKALMQGFNAENSHEKIAHPLSNIDTNIMNVHVNPILSHGGTQMHSYSDKEVSEDIIFQGNWLSPIKELPKSKTIIIKTRSMKKIHTKLSKENILKRTSLPRVDSAKRKAVKDKTALNKESLTNIQKLRSGFNYLQKPLDVHELTTVTQISIPIKNVKTNQRNKSPPKFTQKRTSSGQELEINNTSSTDSNKCEEESRNEQESVCSDNIIKENVCSDNIIKQSKVLQSHPVNIYRSSSDSSCSSYPDSIETVRRNTQSHHNVMKSTSSLSFTLKDSANNNENMNIVEISHVKDQSENDKIIEGPVVQEKDLGNNTTSKFQMNNHDSLQTIIADQGNCISTKSEDNSMISNEYKEELISGNSVIEYSDSLETNLNQVNESLPGENEGTPKALLTSSNMNKDLGQFSRTTSSPVPSEEQTNTPRSVDLSTTIEGSAPSDTSEYITVVDFETGSVDVIRKTTPDFDDSTSSVASYFSCNVDENVSTPNGMFQNPNSLQEEEEEDVSRTLSNVFNENTEMSLEDLETSVVIEAGAGDGRGVHSDSQNSTGIDTSLNSDSNSDVSSGPITDAVTVHESSISGDYDLLEENRSIIVLPDYEAENQYSEDPPEPRIIIHPSRDSEYQIPNVTTGTQDSDE